MHTKHAEPRRTSLGPFGSGIHSADALPTKPRVVVQSRRPSPADAVHFHYDFVDLGAVEFSLADQKLDVECNNGRLACSSQVHVNERDRPLQHIYFRVQVRSGGKSWTVRRKYENFADLDAQLHRCVFERRVSMLQELPPLEIASKLSSKIVRFLLKKYLERLSAIAENSISCHPILCWFELDNHGFHVRANDEISINTPAIATAYVIQDYLANYPDEISLKVGDIVSVIDMPLPQDSVWWRGKLTIGRQSFKNSKVRFSSKTFQVGYFPSFCVRLINSAHRRPSLIDDRLSTLDPVILRKRTNLPLLFRNFFVSRPNRRKLKDGDNAKAEMLHVFGCDLVVHLQATGNTVPLVLRSCSKVIETHGIIDGIYRLSGTSSNIQKLRECFDRNELPDMLSESFIQDIHSVASVLKLYFRELPNPLLTAQLYSKFLDALQSSSDHEKVIQLHNAVQELPPPFYRTAKFLFEHLCRVAQHYCVTGMHYQNLAIVWAPNLLRHVPENRDTRAIMEVANFHTVVVEYLIRYVSLIFTDEAPELEHFVRAREFTETTKSAGSRFNAFEESCSSSQHTCHSEACASGGGGGYDDAQTSSFVLSDMELSRKAISDTSSFEDANVKKYYRKQRYNKGWATRKQLRKQLRNSAARKGCEDLDRRLHTIDVTETPTNDVIIGDPADIMRSSNSEQVSVSCHSGPSISYHSSFETRRLCAWQRQAASDESMNWTNRLESNAHCVKKGDEPLFPIASVRPVTKMHIGSPLLQQHSKRHPRDHVDVTTPSDQSLSTTTFSDFPTSPVTATFLTSDAVASRMKAKSTASDPEARSSSSARTSSRPNRKLILKIAVDAPISAFSERCTSSLVADSLMTSSSGPTLRNVGSNGSSSTDVDDSDICGEGTINSNDGDFRPLSSKNIVSVQVASATQSGDRATVKPGSACRLDPEVESLLCSVEDIPVEEEATKRYNSFSEASAIFDYLYGSGRSEAFAGKSSTFVNSVYENLTSPENSPDKEALYDFPVPSPSSVLRHNGDHMFVDSNPGDAMRVFPTGATVEPSSSWCAASNDSDNVLKKYSDYICTRICLSFGKEESLMPTSRFRSAPDESAEADTDDGLNPALRNSLPRGVHLQAAGVSSAAVDVEIEGNAEPNGSFGPAPLQPYTKRFVPPPAPPLGLSTAAARTSSSSVDRRQYSLPSQDNRETAVKPEVPLRKDSRLETSASPVTLPRSKKEAQAQAPNASDLSTSYFNRLSLSDGTYQKNLHYYYV